MVIFHGYVSLPGGIICRSSGGTMGKLWILHLFLLRIGIRDLPTIFLPRHHRTLWRLVSFFRDMGELVEETDQTDF
jgi:hypothetical protein